jgi:hypothetical protein
MAFTDQQAAENRLRGDSTKLTEQEVRDLMPWMGGLSTPAMRRLDAELSLQNLQAVQTFEKSSGRLTRWLIVLTAVLVPLTITIAWYTYALAHQVR